MNSVHIGNLDLNLLVVADTMYGSKCLGRRRVGLVPVCSQCLRRMRSHFDDPMFVRTTKGAGADRACSSTAKRY